MADFMSILSSNYLTVGNNIASTSSSKYVDVDREAYQGSWEGKYANGDRFSISISNVTGFRATVKYQSGATTKYQQVLIRDNAFKIGDSKFTLAREGVAQVKTVMTNAATGASTLETAYAERKT